jgi:5'-3' exoribonuclease 2
LRPHTFIRTLATAALIAIPSIAMAAPDSNTNGNNGCRGGQWVNGQCVYNNNNNNNGRWNNNGNGRDRDDNRNGNNRDRDDRNRNNGQYNNGQYNNGQYNNGQYNNGQYNNGYGNYGYGNNGNNGNWNYGRGNNMTGTVSSFSPYNLYLSNGRHVELHNGTVINPTGTNLSPGMRVRIVGNQNSDGTFNANEIDVVGNGRY